MEVIFAIARQLFAEMSNEKVTFASQDIKSKEKLLNTDLTMDENVLQNNKKGKSI